MLDLKNSFLFPKKNILGYIIEKLINNRLLNNLKEILNYPFTGTKLKSDVKNVAYYNWLIEIDQIRHLVPPGIKLEEYNGLVLLTILNYNHGNFRPRILDKFKHLFGSPNQSNWRLYIDNKAIALSQPTVLFISNILSSKVYAIGSRLFSNIMKTHYPMKFNHIRNGFNIETLIESGESNSPSVDFKSTIVNKWDIPEEFNVISTDRINLLIKICNQDIAITQLNRNKLCISEIKLDFELDKIIPLSLDNLESSNLFQIVEGRNCFAFLIPELTFYTLTEKTLKV